MKWVIRLVLLVLVWVTASHSYEASIQVIENITLPSGVPGQMQLVECRTFDYDPCLRVEEATAFLGNGGLQQLQDTVGKFQMLTFMWGGASLVLVGGIVFSFRKPSKPQPKEPVA